MTANALFAPNPDTMIKTTAGGSYISRSMDSYQGYGVREEDVHESSETMEKYKDTIAGAQFRADFDRDLKNGFLFSAGAEELYRNWSETLSTNTMEDVYNADDQEYRTYSRVYPDTNNTGLFFYPGKKTHIEAYLAVENALSLFYRPKAGTIVNPYTGDEEEAVSTPQFELPIPMVSFGFKWMY